MEKDEAEEGSDGSREKLLGDNQPDESRKDENVPDEEEHEDEDIAKLMGFQDAETDDGPWVSASESSFKTREEIDMKLIRPVILRPKSEEVYINTTPPTVTSYRPLPTAILKRQAKMQKMYAKHSSQTSKIVCGILCIFIILGIGAVLLLLARMKKMNDLYIIGGIFACGGVLFTISFIILRCSEDKRLAVTDYSALYKSPVE